MAFRSDQHGSPGIEEKISQPFTLSAKPRPLGVDALLKLNIDPQVLMRNVNFSRR
jgi:hypothetical protein